MRLFLWLVGLLCWPLQSHFGQVVLFLIVPSILMVLLYKFSSRRRMVALGLLVALTYVLSVKFPGNPFPDIHPGFSFLLCWIVLVPLLFMASFFARLRWKMVTCVLVIEIVTLISEALFFVFIYPPEFRQARLFLDEVEQVTFYRARFHGTLVADPDSVVSETRTDANSGMTINHYNYVPFESIRDRLTSFEISPKETREIFSHGVYKMKPGMLIWKGSRLGVAKMRDGSEKMLNISMYGGFYTVDGLKPLFSFDEIGRKKWDAVDQRYREFLMNEEKAKTR